MLKIITKDSIGTLVRKGIGNSLRTASMEFGLKPPISIIDLIRLAESQTPEKTPRSISVSSEGSGTSTVFVVTGDGFTPGKRVVIRITDRQLNQLQFPETAGGDGKFVSRCSVRCGSGFELTITAFEDADPLGTFANTIVTHCP